MSYLLSLLLVAWLALVALQIHYAPEHARLFALCIKYTFLGLARCVGLY